MHQKIIYFILTLLTVIVITLLWSNNTPKENYNTDSKLTVAATIFPLADIAQNIGGPNIEVLTLVKPGTSPHTFQASPSDVKNLQKASLLFQIGHDLDDWTLNISNAVDTLPIIAVDKNVTLREFGHNEDEHEDEHYDEDEHDKKESEDEHGHEGTDPHYWLSAKNAKIIAQNIADELIKIDPTNKELYKSNLENYQKELDQLDMEITNTLKDINNTEMIVFHDSWAYFTNEYGLEVVGVFEPSPGKEPGPQYLKDLNDTAREHNIKVVFSEPQLSSEILESFVKDLGLEIHTIDPLGGIGQRDSFVKLLKYNAETIKNALE